MRDAIVPPSLVQAAQAAGMSLDKVAESLAEAGGGPSDVVEVTSYHADIRTDFAEIEAVLHAQFSNPLPAWTAVGVAELRRPGALVEFRVVAYQPRVAEVS